ncbi:MAG: hypothetical protein K6356_06065 [Chloroflexus sp.]
MILRKNHRFIWILLVCQLSLFLVLPTSARAQDEYIVVWVSMLIRDDNTVLVSFMGDLENFSEIRWRWNQPPDANDEWTSFSGHEYFADVIVSLPPNYVPSSCQKYPLFIDLRRQNGTIRTLEAFAQFDNNFNPQATLMWPERAMAGYTNQNTIRIEVKDPQACTSREGTVRVQYSQTYFILSPGESFNVEFPLPNEDTKMPVIIRLWRLMVGSLYHELELIRDTTPPVLANINARIDDGLHWSNIEIAGDFVDTYAPLPWAIEWQFLTSNGHPIGEPVYHVLTADEVWSEGGTAFQLNVSLPMMAVPAQAEAVQVSLFDRAGNGQMIASPLPIVPRHTVFIPFVGR